MESAKFFSDLWPLVLSIVGLIVWLARLEALASQNREEWRDQKRKLEEFDSKIVEELGEVRESLARLEGALGINRNLNKN